MTIDPTMLEATRALVIQVSKEQRKPVSYDAGIVERPLPKPQSGEVVVQISAAGFNHKDVGAPTVDLEINW